MGSACLSFIILSLALAANAALFTDSSQLTKTSYDYVVVGGGTAGGVVANRLTENPAINVLVIEAGINNADDPLTQVPFIGPSLLADTSKYWEYKTTPQPKLNNRVLPLERGKMLGGSSSENFVVFSRGSRADFDTYAKQTGDPGWSWDALFPYLMKYEGFTAPVDGHSTTGQVNPAVHGVNGPLRTTVANFPSAIDSRVIATTQSNPQQFPFNNDVNSGDTIGFGWALSTSGNGVRSSSATAYIEPALQRPNLDVLVNTQVTRLLNCARSSTPDLRKVEFATNATSPRKTIMATREVVLSAGAVNSAQILLLSGIGNAKNLTALGIPVLKDSPGVGQNFQDHPFLAAQFSVNSNDTLDDFFRSQALQGAAFQQWQANHTGQLSAAPGNQYGFFRIPSNSTIFTGFTDPNPGPTSAHFELLPANAFLSFADPRPDTGSFITIITTALTPASRGSVRLTSANPFDFPAVDPAYLSSDLDAKVLVFALRTAMAFLATDPWKDISPQPFGGLAGATTDAQLDAFVRNGVTTFWHTSGTAKMGSPTDKMAVVDSKLRVKGVTGVRVVDGSIFPFIPSGHMQGTVYVIAERGADLIKQSQTIHKIH